MLNKNINIYVQQKNMILRNWIKINSDIKSQIR